MEGSGIHSTEAKGLMSWLAASHVFFLPVCRDHRDKTMNGKASLLGGVLAPELSRQTISHGLKEERDCPIFKGNP